MSLFKSLALVFVLLGLGACGFQPLYGKGATGNASEEFSKIRILPIKDRIGQQLRNRLLAALHPRGTRRSSLFILRTRVNEGNTSLAVRKSAFATRANLTVTATFELVSAGGGGRIFSGTSAITVSYNILDSDFATLAAEKDARRRAVREIAEDMRSQLGAHFFRTGGKNKASK